jgi:branched-chain amino acid aminotransferase
VSLIHHRGRDVKIPMGKTGVMGEYTAKVKGWLKDIMYGNEEHEWGVVVTKE